MSGVEKTSGVVKVYRLSAKFVDRRQAPPEVEQLKLYTLALGHHIGVVDCLSPVLSVDAEDFFELVRRLPDGPARRKLAGVARWGEIEIHREHARELLDALAGAGLDVPEQASWQAELLETVRAVEQTPAMYLVVRLCEAPGDHDR